MQRCLEGACEEGERTIKKIKTSRPSLPLLRPQESVDSLETPSPAPPFCLSTELFELYREESAKEPNCDKKAGLRQNSRILEKLVARERLNTLILNLYPGLKGYSFAFRTHPRTHPKADDTANMFETKQWPYEEMELLSYINNEEIPPLLTDLFEKNYSFLYYNGCIIVEIRDYRQYYPHSKCDIHHVLLRPTLTSLLADINNVSDEKPDWSPDDKQQFESKILLANNPILCLDPSSLACEPQTRLNHNRQMWNTHSFRRAARKFSKESVNRKRKLDQFTHRPGLGLFDFLARSRAKPKTDDKKATPVIIDAIPLAPPTQGVFINEFKTFQRPKETGDCMPQLVEEYVLETDMPSKEKDKQRVYHIKLSILQRPSNSEYLGELYLDGDHKNNERNGVACRFSLGTRANANRYIHQLTDIITEKCRKSVRIRYGLSSGYKERVAIAQAQIQQGNMPQQHLNQLNQTLQIQNQATVANGTVASRISLVQTNQSIPNTSNVPILLSHLQGTTQMKPTAQELEINAITNQLMNSPQQFQAAANAKLTPTRGNTALISLPNSSPANNKASDAINSALQPQQVQTINQKVLAARKMPPNATNARVLNHNNLITVNNRLNMNISNELNAQQAHTSANYTSYATVPIKQQMVGQPDNNKALSALLVGTPAADHPDIVAQNTNPLLDEKLGAGTSTGYIQGLKAAGLQYIQAPAKVGNPVASPTQNSSTINFAQLHNLSGLQNVQVQLSGISQPISLSLNVSSAGNVHGHPTSLLVSMPVTTATNTSSITQTAGGVGAPTVVLASAAGAPNIAQLVSKGVGQVGIRTGAGPQTMNISGQGGQAYQLVTTPIQRPRTQQTTLQRTPITLKMATQNSNATQTSLASQLQKQAQFQQYQQLCLNQQQNANVTGKMRRRSNTSEQQ